MSSKKFGRKEKARGKQRVSSLVLPSNLTRGFHSHKKHQSWEREDESLRQLLTVFALTE